MRLIKDHWYRTLDDGPGPCAFPNCGEARHDHREACGEWMDPTHWFRPSLRRLFRCARCGRTAGHSTHRGSPKNRSIHRVG